MSLESLKIGILSRNPRCYSTRRLREAALANGHQVKVLDTLKFGIFVEPKSPHLTFRGKNLSEYDAIIPRIGTSVTFYGTAVVRQFEQMGVFCLNSSAAIGISRDKLRSMQVLSRHDIGIAQTAFVSRKEDVLPAIEQVGGAPVIIKLIEGTQGVGVILADSNKIAEAIVETLQSTKQNVLIQKFVAESRGRDIRAFVVGDRVVAAMRRRAQGQEFRSNVHRGGTTEAVRLDEAYERTAVRAAQIMGLRVAGVDMLEGKDGPVIMEVNSSPGLEGIEAACEMDIAGEIIRYLAEHIRFGDLDLRQRLSFARGYAVSEFTVTANSKLDGIPLTQSGLKERGIIVMSINRNGQHFPAPTGDDELHHGDKLLCYGPKTTLQDYLPLLTQRKRRKLAAKKRVG
ncbi:30S ribosomal protein S6--L-glutamate ligase [Coraliomargarita parva]|uniref:30S ribosomal protein S6--L-glutamate ligase n=1 Tax=Coraliomargarita parva TaxID=3014050 RepID=UPI0022B3C99F|nr:30S ribosomal protein S6--L-glutamate ligase [Coraliomargarita parva]